MPHRGDFFEPLDYFEAAPTDGETKKAPNSDWAFDHKADVAAHHAKYTDAEARAVHSPLSFPPPAFLPGDDTYDFDIACNYLMNRASLEMQLFRAPVILPQGVTVTKLTLYGYRDDAAATLQLILQRGSRTGMPLSMAMVTAGWTTGNNSGYIDSIDYATIDNETYNYTLQIMLNPNDSVNDVKLTGALIEFS